MTELCGKAVEALPYLAVENDTAADACTEGHGYQRILTYTAAPLSLCVSRSIGIVGNKGRSAGKTRNDLTEFLICPAEVKCIDNNTVSYNTGCCNADPLYVGKCYALPLTESETNVLDIRRYLFAGTGCACFYAFFMKNDLAVKVDKSHGDICTAEIYAYTVSHNSPLYKIFRNNYKPTY